MLNGIYRVTFQVAGNQGKGILVVKDGWLYGGDTGFVYSGTFELQGNQIIAKARIQNDFPGVQSIFNPFLTDFLLELTGQQSAPGFKFQGSVTGQPALLIIVEGTKIKDL